MRETDHSADKKINLELWKRLMRYALRYKGLVAGIIATMLATAAIDIAYPLLTRYAIDNFVLKGSGDGVGGFFGLYILLVAVQGAHVWLFVTLAGKLEMRVCADIRRDAFKKLQELSISFYDNTSVGYLLARMVSDISRLSEMIAWSFVDVLWAAAFVVGCSAAMLALSVKLALLAFSVIPVFVAVCLIFQQKILFWQRKVRKTNSRITSAFNEGILGLATTKTLVREDANCEEFQELTDSMRRQSVRAALLSAVFMPIVLFLGCIGTAFALYGGTGDVLVGALSLGTLAAFISYTAQFFEPVQQLARIVAELQTAQASAERVISLLDTENEITDAPEVVEKYGDCFDAKTQNWEDVKGDVEFKNITFSYGDGERVLEDFSLKINAGETLAIVGETGAGKSTIVNLICRFYEPTKGAVEIDGVDVRARSSLWLEKKIGYVMQTPHLFSGTIGENIAFGADFATKDEIREAARQVGADAFIEKFPDGYDTLVGEEGAALSVGQKQLISFARVLLVKPRIFLLDEATSSIDTETELLIKNAIKTVLRGRTAVMVAHRLSTVRDADRIIVLDMGKIIEDGSHDELIRKHGAYYNLYVNHYAEERRKALLGE